MMFSNPYLIEAIKTQIAITIKHTIDKTLDDKVIDYDLIGECLYALKGLDKDDNWISFNEKKEENDGT